YMRLEPTDARGPLAHAIAYRNIAGRKRPPDQSMLGGALSDLANAKKLASSQSKREIGREATQARAEILSQLGRYAEAEDEWKPIYEAEGSGNVDAVLGYGSAARRAGHLKVAERVLEAGAKKNPDHAGIKFELGRARVEAGDITTGVKDMEAALS